MTLIRCLLALCLLAAAGQLRTEEYQAGCIDCHTASADVPVHAIFNTPHGALAGGGDDSCKACHGVSEDHAAGPSNAAPDASFGPRWFSTAEERSSACMGCHESGQHLMWAGSEHEIEGLACDSCHDSHQQSDPTSNRDMSVDMCLDCHQQVQAEVRLPSRHPILESKTACTDCHNPHGASTGADLHQVSVNDNCLSCHEELRGPFLWEHQPVTEDCSHCHRPHGSVHPRLLKARGPALCQQCHSAAFHPSLPYGGEGLPGGTANQNVLGKNCMNCHGQVHGSNHPSGARLTR
mgnify:FL=1